MRPFAIIGAFALGSAALWGCRQPLADTTAQIRAAAPDRFGAERVARNANRSAYFGELHLHTAVSFDSYLMGARVGPEDAYRFARGDTIDLMGGPLRRMEPLDFIAITDHAEQMGLGTALDDASSVFSRTRLGQDARRQLNEGGNTFDLMMKLQQARTDGIAEAGRSAWTRNIELANRYYRPGAFTTLIGYEWSSTPDGQNIHRNVIFRGNGAPFPFSSQDSAKPEDLWQYLEANRAKGIEALAIPHNGNASNGLMYDWLDSDRRPIDESYAQRRMVNEPLSEIVQNKGQSETHPLLSPNDEFANFEIFDVLFGPEQKPSKVDGSYVRNAYARGLALAERLGANPYKFGVAGGTDLHDGLGDTNEQAYGGTTTLPGARLPREQVRKNLGLAADPAATIPSLATSPGALTGVWAEANTREAIFDALRRKETFATSGTRLKVRLFGGWTYAANLVLQRDWIGTAYAGGVAMGGDLPSRPRAASASAPRFIIWAAKDPNGANLDRAQIIKVWFDGGTPRERVFDVALSGNRKPDTRSGKVPPVGNTVDLGSATYANTIGAVELATVWVDPAFDSAQPAVYYLRVLEIPTPRWTTIAAVRHKLPLPRNSPATIQERGWSSPIWYTPQRARP